MTKQVKAWLQCSDDYWHKQRMRVLVRDNFTCQWEAIHQFIPNPDLYDKALYEKVMAQWQKLELTPIKMVCDHHMPESRLRVLQVHHIIQRVNFLRQQTEGHDMSNLVTICTAHHEQIHPHMAYIRGMPLKNTGSTFGLKVPDGWTIED